MKKITKIIFAMMLIVLLSGFVACNEDKIKEITVTGINTSVVVGEEIDTSSIKVVVTYKDNSTLELNSGDFEMTKPDTNTTGTKKVVVTYEGEKAEVEITVVGVKSLTVRNFPNSIYQNEDADFSDVSATAKFDDDSTRVLGSSRLTFSEVDTTTLGEKTVTITYKGFSIEKNVVVVENDKLDVTNIRLLQEINTVRIDEQLDTSNLVEAVITHKDGTEETIAVANLSLTPMNIETVTNARLRVGYEGYYKTFPVTVIAIDHIEVIGELPAQINSGDEIEIADYITGAKIVYTDDTEKEVSLDALTIGNVNTLTAGEKQLDVSYKTLYNFHIDYEVTEFELIDFAKPQSLTEYESAKTNTTGNVYFDDRTQDYVVGNENAFVLVPNITAMIDGEFEEAEKVATTIDFEISDDGLNFEVLADKDQYITSVGKYNVEILFNANAVNKYFKITVYAKGDTTKEYGSFTHTFKVVNGYNIYKATDLALLDNTNPDWNEIKEKNGLTNVNTDKIILQKNIEITDKDIPSTFFYSAQDVEESGLSQDIIGSLKDRYRDAWTNIIHRTMHDGENFTITGNYFTIDASKLSLCKYNGDGYTKDKVISMHAVLIKFENDEIGLSNVKYETINFKGNTQRSNETTASGGVILTKARGVLFDADNTTYQQWYIGYFVEEMYDHVTVNNTNYVLNDYSEGYYTFAIGETTYYLSKEDKKVYADSGLTQETLTDSTYSFTRHISTIEHTKGFECYNCLIYVWGSSLNITDSSLKSAGGPVMIVDHSHISDSNRYTGLGGSPSYITIKDTELESLVTGQEPWFVSYSATEVVTQIASADVFYNAYNMVRQNMIAQKDYIVPQIAAAFNVTNEYAEAIFNERMDNMYSTILKTNSAGIENCINLVAVYKSGNAQGLTPDKVRGGIKIVSGENDSHALDLGGANGTLAFGNKMIFENSATGLNLYPNSNPTAEDFEYDQNALTSYATISAEIDTFINIYINNGMGAIIGLYKK